MKNREKKIQSRENDIDEQQLELKEMIRREQDNLQKIAGLTIEGAKKELMKLLEEDARRESVATIKKIEEETKEQALNKARKVIAAAIQRTASERMLFSPPPQPKPLITESIQLCAESAQILNFLYLK